MSKNIVIQESGQGKQLTADKLKTNLVGGGTCLWVPEDDTQLGTKYITNNGTFKASDDGLYGYSEVTVSGIGTVTGKDPDTGEEVKVHTDPETGEIVKTVIPVEIRVTTPPTKTEYTHGETINYSGIVVHAYSSTGQDMGAVPFNQLIFPETIADIQKTDGWTDGHGLNAMMLYYTPKPWIDWAGRESVKYVAQVLGTYNNEDASYGSENDPATALITRYANNNYGVLVNGTSAGESLYAKKEKSETSLEQGWRGVGAAASLSSKTEFTGMAWSEFLTSVPVSSVDPTTVAPSTLHATQSIPVQWQDPDSGAVLETTFTINVTGGE